jgi:hypothetical protein
MTLVISTDITVITVKRCPRDTLIADTLLNTVTDIIVTAVIVVIAFTVGKWGVNTPCGGIAGISCAPILIITEDGVPLATTPGTGVICGTFIAIVTGSGIVAVLAAKKRITPVVGANVTIIAVRRMSASTLVIDTLLESITQISIVTVGIITTGTTVIRAVKGLLFIFGINNTTAVI